MLYRAFNHFTVLLVPESDKPVLKHLRAIQGMERWIGLPGYHHLCQVVEVGPLCGRINENSPLQRLSCETLTNEGAEVIKDRFAGMQENSLLAVARCMHRIAIAQRGR